ncbi:MULTISPECIES: hypothetical protein [unclassified Mameliella]|uniref:hypothetical protein n=1 Tax=Mameliella sp. LZ-28 TaxID=2484146 RepID=UPI00143F483D|nr:hypothetical protein [Mameliella sp. LZ-28]MCR9276245.1 hypothetical protein [Paracoccaceae bacterium]
MAKIIESLADQLTPEEVAAYEAEDEISAEEAIASLNDARSDPDDDDPDPKEDDPEDDPEPKSQADDPDPEDDPDPQKQAEPQVDVKALESDLEEIDAQIDDLGEKRENLEITAEEYRRQMRELNDKRAPLAYRLQQEGEKVEASKTEWANSVRSYFTKNAGLNDGGEMLQAFDRAVRAITGNPKFDALSNDEVLVRAHTLLEKQADVLGLKVPPVKIETKGKQKDGQKPKAKDAKPKEGDDDDALGGTVPTLAKTPASDVGQLDDSPYAQLEMIAQKGDAIALEEAMMRLPPEKRDEFASLYLED